MAVAIAEITAFPPHQYFQTATTSPTGNLAGPAIGDPVSIATNYLRANASSFGVGTSDLNHLVVTNNYVSANAGNLRLIYFGQTYNGLPIANAMANFAIEPDGQILTAAADLVPGLIDPPANSTPTPIMSADMALRSVAGAAGITLQTTSTTVSAPSGRNMHTVLRNTQLSDKDIIAELQYVPKSGGGVQLAWRINVDMRGGQHWYDASVGADMSAPGQLVNVSDWVASFLKNVPPAGGGGGGSGGAGSGGSAGSGFSAGGTGGFADGSTYNVYPVPIESPGDGSRALVTNPSDDVASPFGWHDTNGVIGPESTKTRGNNTNAQDDTDNNDTGGVSPDGGPTLTFDFPIDLTQAASSYLPASTVNLFYWTNIVHDVAFHHGFDEASGNFQVKNYSGQGLGGDPLEADAQDGSGTDNANMATPPDGQSPREQQYIFDLTSPTRDSDIQSDVIVHEFTHGISNRLTGGPANANALNALQSGGMGEGWSDWMALMLTQKTSDTAATPRGSGEWILGQPQTGVGIRRYPYSFDMTIDPLTLGRFNQSNEVHDAGEIWCSALNDMAWLIMNKSGFNTDLYSNTGGNNLAMDIVLLGMKLQPANPTFLQARDAILAADAQLTGSDNFDEIWTAFARRGFGLSANVGIDANATSVTEAFDRPPPTSKISGLVYHDTNGDGVRNTNEGPLAGWTVYIDKNNNGVLDSGEKSAISNAAGVYQLSVFNTGNLTIREVVQPFFTETQPQGDGAYHITLTPGQNKSGLDFGNLEQPGEIDGHKWSDVNGNGVQDPGEPPVQGVVIYVDVNNDGRIGLGEPAAVTDANGNYTIKNIRLGLYTVREVYQPGMVQTFPGLAAPDFGAHFNVQVNAGQITPNIDFGNQAAFDYGDAPAPYPTLKSQNGAVHGILTGFGLGAAVDAEADGQPSVNADGDDFNGNEIQTVSLPTLTTAGTFTLTFSGQTTAPIAFNANAAAVKSALEALTNVGVGEVTVTGGPGPANPWVITFQGTLANQNLFPMTGNGSLLVPTGGVVVIATQQNGGLDDEDGVVLGNLIPGVDGNATVTVRTGTFAAGYLNAWIDFNRDGDWNDPGEQIFTDRQLATGTYNLTFPVPVDTTLGPTYARFRYSLDPGIGPTGLALGGEVEDYRLFTLGITPTAIDDSFTVDSGSLLSQNRLNVLANDLSSASGPPGIDAASAPTTSTAGGTVFLDDNGTVLDSTDDFFRYQPPANFTNSTDTFQYRDIDPQGHVSAPATVSIFVRFVPRDPIAVDDTFEVTTGSSNVPLRVLSNDIPGTGGAISLLSNTTPQFGTVTVNNNGTPADATDDFYSYTPPANPPAAFHGSDSFTYTIRDPANKTDTANVWIQVNAGPPAGSPGADDIIQFELQLLDATDNHVIANGELIRAGTTIIVRGLVSDLRGPVVDPVSGQDFEGAQTAYMDLLYDRFHIQASGVPLQFGPQYQFGQSGSGGTPGLIDEVGAAHSDLTAPLGPGKKLVFTKQFVAQTVTGSPIQFIADPADISPQHDITAYFPSSGRIDPVPRDEVFYKPSPTFSVIAASEGEDTNMTAPMDVNADGVISPIDALLVVNFLNESMAQVAGEGESATPIKRDVNHDNQISPIDALLVINYLNANKGGSNLAAGEGEAEGESSAPSTSLSSAVLTAPTATSQTTATPGTDATAAPGNYARSVDHVFGQINWSKPTSNRGDAAFYSSPASSSIDDFFARLETGLSRRTRKAH